MKFYTGYFGRAKENGHRGCVSKTHLIDADTGKPLCRYKPYATMVFQWRAGFVYLPYLECESCKVSYPKALHKEAERFEKEAKKIRLSAKKFKNKS
jgi:hypothetical protein